MHLLNLGDAGFDITSSAPAGPTPVSDTTLPTYVNQPAPAPSPNVYTVTLPTGQIYNPGSGAVYNAPAPAPAPAPVPVYTAPVVTTPTPTPPKLSPTPVVSTPAPAPTPVYTTQPSPLLPPVLTVAPTPAPVAVTPAPTPTTARTVVPTPGTTNITNPTITLPGTPGAAGTDTSTSLVVDSMGNPITSGSAAEPAKSSGWGWLLAAGAALLALKG